MTPPRWIPPPAHGRRGLYLALAVVVLVAAGVGLANWLPGGGPGAAQTFPGTLVLQAGVPWRAPTGETVSGLLAYTPKSGAVEPLLPPDVAATVTGGWLSPSGRAFYGISRADGAVSLLRVPLDPSGAPTTIAQVPAASAAVGFAALSADDASVAYVRYPAADDASSDAGFAPELYVADASGGGAHSLGAFIPIAFSPDASTLLAASSTEYELLPLAGGSPRPVNGLPTHSLLSIMRASPDGRFLAVQNAGALVVGLYAFDWAQGAATLLGTVALSPADSWGFSSDSRFLVAHAGELTAYAPAAGLPVSAQYPLASFPQSAQILSTAP